MSAAARIVAGGFAVALATGAAPAQEIREIPLSQRWQESVTLNTMVPTHSFSISIGSSDLLTLDVRTWPAEAVVEIITPSGAPLDSAYVHRVAVGPDDVPPVGALLFAEGYHVQAQLAAPSPGIWNVRATLPAGASSADVSVAVFIAGGLSVGLTASRSEYQSGQPVVLTLAAFRRDIPEQGLTATADVYAPGSELTPRTLSLRDDGQGSDASAGDGLYSGTLSDLIPGHYLVEATVRSGNDLARAAARFDVIESQAMLQGTKRDSGVDANGDGLYDEIAVDVDVQVDRASTYTVLAMLTSDSAGSPIPAATKAVLPAGLGSVRVRFAADEIRGLFGQDGPWVVSDVRLLWTTDTGRDIVVDRVADLGPTSPYLLGQLQRPVTVFLEGISERAIDTDTNGLFDALQATMRVDTLRAGSYTWTATVRAADGTPLDVSVGRGTLPVGVSTIGFSFDGKAIGASGKDGPYLLLDAGIYGPPEAAALQSIPAETQSYRFTQFEGSAVTISRLIELVKALPIFGRGGVPLAEGLRKSLLEKLEQARTLNATGQHQAALGLLKAFLQELAALGEDRVRPSDLQRLSELTASIIPTLMAA